MAWQTPKTNWSIADGVRDADFNRMEENTQYLYENKADLSAFDALRQSVDDTLFEVSRRVELGNITNGGEFGLHENGILTPFIKLTTNYEGSGRILVVRKDCYKVGPIRETGDTLYEGCLIDDWLSNEYITYLSSTVQTVLADVFLKVWGSFGEGTLSRKAFLLSMREYRLSSVDGIPGEGSDISYFSSNDKRISRRDGEAISHWTRSIDNPRTNACYVSAFGTYAIGNPNTLQLGIRPAFTLPATFEVTTGLPSTANVLADTEVIE